LNAATASSPGYSRAELIHSSRGTFSYDGVGEATSHAILS
jgi:hypothetical protein